MAGSIKLVCAQCGKAYERLPGRATQYCSTQCYHQSRVGTKHGPYRATRPSSAICETCGRTFEPSAHSAGKYCSTACYDQARTGRARGPYKGFEVQTRECPVCGTAFDVGPYARTGKWWNVAYCSPKCMRQGKPSRSRDDCKQLSDLDAAYLAGLVDGEGSIFLYKRTAGVVGRLIVVNTYRPIIDWLIDTTGAGGVGNHPATEHHKHGYMWAVNGTIAESLVRQIRPYLKIKHAQADIFLDLQERRRVPRLKADLTWQAESLAQMRALNRRGPAQLPQRE